MNSFQVFNGDCLKVLKKLPSNSLDSLVADPPAGISFMGKEWDEDKGGRNEWINWLTKVMTECCRVLKPGAHGLVWAIPRTSHWTAMALEYAGFEIRDVITHLFGSGFPKSLNISKAIDSSVGAEREVVGWDQSKWRESNNHTATWAGKYDSYDEKCKITSPSTLQAKKWEGWGTALKPASEHWILVRKPLAEGTTVIENVLKHGVGGLNIDGCRIGSEVRQNQQKDTKAWSGNTWSANPQPSLDEFKTLTGRFPSNLVLSHNPDCVEVGVKKVKSNGHHSYQRRGGTFIDGIPSLEDKGNVHASPDGTETVASFECTPGCAVSLLDEQAPSVGGSWAKSQGSERKKGTTGFDVGMANLELRNQYVQPPGGASRFFYCAKASKSDKGVDNTHPTVKSSKLMSYLIKLITPPNGVVLDPFMGSGSTGVAALSEGVHFVGIEREREYFDIASKRLENAELTQFDD